MAVVLITGTIQDSAGAGVVGAAVRVTPVPSEPSAGQAYGGIGLVLDPREYLTDGAGAFSVPITTGFAYSLDIPAIGYSRSFVAPAVDTRFDLLGFVPDVEGVVDYTDEAGDPHNLITVRAIPIAVLLERFSEIELERATTKGGTYTLIETIPLEAGIPAYKYVDAAANTVYYRARYHHPTNGDSSYSVVRPSATYEEQMLMSVNDLKATYLFGVNLTDPNTGEPYPAEMFENYIRAAVGWLEKELDIRLLAQNFTDERHDHLPRDYSRWGWFDLDEYPIIRVDRVWFQYPSMEEEVAINQTWIEVLDDGRSGTVNIVPGRGSIADVLLMPGSLLPLWGGSGGRTPAVWHFDYRAGFEPANLPPEIKHLIGMAASIGILNIAGDLIAGAGVASLSISVPGLSQSIGTTSSATNSGYGSRIIQYQKDLKQQIPVIRRYWKGIRMVVV